MVATLVYGAVGFADGGGHYRGIGAKRQRYGSDTGARGRLGIWLAHGLAAAPIGHRGLDRVHAPVSLQPRRGANRCAIFRRCGFAVIEQPIRAR